MYYILILIIYSTKGVSRRMFIRSLSGPR